MFFVTIYIWATLRLHVFHITWMLLYDAMTLDQASVSAKIGDHQRPLVNHQIFLYRILPTEMAIGVEDPIFRHIHKILLVDLNFHRPLHT